MQARALNDLIFFGVRGRVITEDFRRETARPCDSTAIVGNVRKLMHLALRRHVRADASAGGIHCRCARRAVVFDGEF